MNVTAFYIRASLAVTALVAGAVLVGGCGNSTVEGTSAPAQAPKSSVAAPKADPASTPVKFDQLTLQSKPVKSTDADGTVWVSFKYVDNDGKVYKCKMPEAQTQGEFVPAIWLSTFATYKEPEPVKEKAVVTDKGAGIDYPFISPKPKAAPTDQQPAAGGAPAPSGVPGG